MGVFFFYVAAVICVISAVLALTRANAAHALIYLVVMMLGLAVIFFVLGAPFAAALQIVIYAGAILVLFLFVVMMLNLGRTSVKHERQWLQPTIWVGPGILGLVLLAIVLLLMFDVGSIETSGAMVGPKEVGIALFTEYILAVELAGVLLLAGLVSAYHLGRRYLSDRREEP